ncbi:MAG: hypothetical protein GX457_14390 [Thermotogaceae bacterium]|jgi:hypothetical protein|nr:hypothetical protein [Thermotogaceae bacterium]
MIYWSVFVEYEEKEDRNVEKLTQALDERQKLSFERLKEWRKKEVWFVVDLTHFASK